MKSVKNTSNIHKTRPTFQLRSLRWTGTCGGKKIEKVHNLEFPLSLQKGDNVNITWSIHVEEK